MAANKYLLEKLNNDFKVDEEKVFGPKNIRQNNSIKPSFVWITGESIGDNDPAMSHYQELPVIFIFDIELLSKLQLSTKRINFLLDCLKEINNKRELQVHLTNPNDYLLNKNLHQHLQQCQKYKKITERNITIYRIPSISTCRSH